MFATRLACCAPGGLITVLALAALPAAASAAQHPRATTDSPRHARPPAGTGRVLAPGAGFAAARGRAAVRSVQRGLRQLGYRPGPADGRYGPRTTAAVTAFQRRRALRADGIVGPVTRRALAARVRAAGGRRVLAPGAGLTSPHGSDALRRLQRELRRLDTHPGAVDGRYGPRTTAAVAAFQRRHGLDADGVAGPDTLRRLRRAERSGRSVVDTPAPAPVSHATPTPHLPPASPATPHPATPKAASRLSNTAVRSLLLALLALGAAVLATSYARTRARVRRWSAPQPPQPQRQPQPRPVPRGRS